MKQRLLLSLLMLMVSVGFAVGQNPGDGTMTFTLQKGNTISVSSVGGTINCDFDDKGWESSLVLKQKVMVII